MAAFNGATFGASKNYTDEHGGGGGGTKDYNQLDNKPRVSTDKGSAELQGNVNLKTTLKVLTDTDKDNLEDYIKTKGSHIQLTYDQTTEKLNAYLKDENNNTISSSSIDLILEGLVVGGEYNATNKTIELTLKDVATPIVIPVGDLVDGLLSESNQPNKIYGTDDVGNQKLYDADDLGKVKDIKVDGVSIVDSTNKEVNMETDASAIDDMFDDLPDVDSIKLSDLLTDDDKTSETLDDNTKVGFVDIENEKNIFYKLLQIWTYITTKTTTTLTTTAKNIIDAINEIKSNADGRSRLVGVFHRTADFNIPQNAWTPVNFNGNNNVDTNYVKANGNYIQIVKTGVYKFTVTARIQDGAGGYEWAIGITDHQDDATGGCWAYTVNRHKIQTTFVEYYTEGKTIRPEIYIVTSARTLNKMDCNVEYMGQ